MSNDRAIFQDDQGRGWLVEVQYGHPAPTELGHLRRALPVPGGPGGAGARRVPLPAGGGGGDEGMLREALAEAEPAQEIG
jgi:hypothetical protein